MLDSTTLWVLLLKRLHGLLAADARGYSSVYGLWFPPHMLWLLVMVQGLMSSVQRLTDVALSQLFLPAQPDPTSLTRQKELSAIELSLLSLLICNSYCTCSICAHDLAFRRALRKVAWELSGVQLCAGV